jgi:CxxC motif-containing protein (DUF1111 family)
MKQFMYLAVIAIGVTIVACNETTGNTAGGEKKTDSVEEVARGKYLVDAVGCGDCHTPKTMTPQGPVPDMEKFLSGYDASQGSLGKFDTSIVRDGRWALLKGDLTAAVGPWGITIQGWVAGHTRISAGLSRKANTVVLKIHAH